MPSTNQDLVVFTLTTDLSHPGLTRLAKSAEKFDIPLGVVSIPPGKPYKEIIRTKHLLIRDKLEEFEALGFQRFLFLDAWDTLFVGPLNNLIHNAKNLNFGAEKNCYPGKKSETRYKTQEEVFPYLNSGVIWGDVDTYLDLCPDAYGHDQGMWTEVYFQSPEAVTLDHKAEVVLNLHSTKDEDLGRIPGGGVHYGPTNTSPLIIHGNGKWPIPLWMEK